MVVNGYHMQNMTVSSSYWDFQGRVKYLLCLEIFKSFWKVSHHLLQPVQNYLKSKSCSSLTQLRERARKILT